MANELISRPFSGADPATAPPDPLATSRPAGGTDPMATGGYTGTSSTFGQPGANNSPSITSPTPATTNATNTVSSGSTAPMSAYDQAVAAYQANPSAGWNYNAGYTPGGADYATQAAQAAGPISYWQTTQGQKDMSAYDSNFNTQLAAGNVQGATQTPGIGQTATANGTPGVLQNGWDPYLTAIAQAQNPGGQNNNLTPGSNQPGFNWNQSSLNSALGKNQIFNGTGSAANGNAVQPNMTTQFSDPTQLWNNPSNPQTAGQLYSHTGGAPPPASGGPQPVAGNMSGQGGAGGQGMFGLGGSPGNQMSNQQLAGPNMMQGYQQWQQQHGYGGQQSNPWGGMQGNQMGGFNSWGNPYQGNPYGYMTGQPNNYSQTMFGGGQMPMGMNGQSGFNNQGVYGGNPFMGGGMGQIISSLLGGMNPMSSMGQMGGLGGLLSLISNFQGQGGGGMQQGSFPGQYNPNPQQFGMYSGA